LLATTPRPICSANPGSCHGRSWEAEAFWLRGVSKVVSTHLWNRPLNLYQQAMKGFLSWLTRGFAWGVLYGCVVIFLECLQSQKPLEIGCP